MRKIYAICGRVGSGKTTFSRRLATETGAFRFTLDEWMIPLFGEHMPRAEFNRRQQQLTELLRQAAVQMLDLDITVIFDFGFWEKRQRIEIKDWAASINAELELIYLRCGTAECRGRALQRNRESVGIYYKMTDEMLQLFNGRFEEPGNGETVTVIHSVDA